MMSDNYPEHLNPFSDDCKKKSTGLKLSDSFREFTRTLRRSFRLNKSHTKEDSVEIRKESVKRPSQLHSLPGHLESPVQFALFPRSRFQERLTKTYNDNPRENINHRISAPNPFDEDSSKNHRLPLRPKKKKKAPLPPKSISTQNINESLNSTNNSSKWSLTSADTDYSFSTNVSGTENNNCDEFNSELKEEFESFHEGMKKLNELNETSETEDTNNNNVPDIVVSCSNDEGGNEINCDENDTKDDAVNENEENLDDKELKEETSNEDESTQLNGSNPILIENSEDKPDECKTYTEECTIYIDDPKDSNDDNNNEEDTDSVKCRKNILTMNDLLGKNELHD